MENMFATDYGEILELVNSVDPVQYGRTRNYADGAVTGLSPYISRGVISTRMVARSVLRKGYRPSEIEVFLKELAWREYFQRVWMEKGNEIDHDLKQAQPGVANHRIPRCVLNGQTGIEAIDAALEELRSTGYMHNHARMYVASICCNLAGSHWQLPARWMYYHLLDADWASNALSWQWVAGSFSNKKYYANQENINRFCRTQQHGTFMDVPYEAFESMDIPDILKDTSVPELKTSLPEKASFVLNPDLPVCIYNFYNLDPLWLADMEANRVLLLEPGFFSKYPVSYKTIQFVLNLAVNIRNMEVFTGDFSELATMVPENLIHFKEHPAASHYRGIRHERDWMFESVTGYHPSFFSFWKKCEKHMEQLADV